MTPEERAVLEEVIEILNCMIRNEISDDLAVNAKTKLNKLLEETK